MASPTDWYVFVQLWALGKLGSSMGSQPSADRLLKHMSMPNENSRARILPVDSSHYTNAAIRLTLPVFEPPSRTTFVISIGQTGRRVLVTPQLTSGDLHLWHCSIKPVSIIGFGQTEAVPNTYARNV